MGASKRNERDLDRAVLDAGFTPRIGDADALFERLHGADDVTAEAIERALARLGSAAASRAMSRFDASRPALRGRLCRLIGRVARQHPAPELRAFLIARLSDDDGKTRRNAVIALGKLSLEGARAPDAEIEGALLTAWPAASIEVRRSIASALGKTGGPRALHHLQELAALPRQESDDELRRIAGEACVKLSRTLERGDATAHEAIDGAAVARSPTRVVLHCRAGLEAILAAELPADLQPRASRVAAVEATLDGPMERLFVARTFLRFGFPLAVATASSDDEVAAVTAAAVTSPAATEIFRTWSRGAPRYRLEWASAGHRRALTFRCAQAIARAQSTLINDPTNSAWEVVVVEKQRGSSGPRRVFVELTPRGLDDPRFSYRRGDVAGASHPTIAAAIARVGGVRDDDVVWDPFCGAGTELIERARFGAYRSLYGSDLDGRAIELARETLDGAGVARARVAVGDARSFVPEERPTLVVTNPPMGRRVLRPDALEALFEGFLARAAQLLAPRGRIAWISPLGDRTAEIAQRLGLRVELRQRVDMGGFSAELQRLARST